MTNITIGNNIIEGREEVTIRARLFTIDAQTGNKHPTNDIIDIAPGQEERVNLASPGIGLEVRVMTPDSLYASDEQVSPDVFAKIDAFEKLKKIIRSVPAIRADATLSDLERDTKATAAWSEALKLASQ